MYHFIVIGNPIAHSKSPQIHQAFAAQTGLDICYQRQFCPNNKKSLTAVIEAFFAGGGRGMNVTLPFKEWAFELCDELSDDAFAAKAVNTLFLKNDKLYGDNTDGRGLVADFLDKDVCLVGKNIAILGAGGAARGAILPLLNQGANIAIFNRTLSKAQMLVQEFQNHLKNNQSLSAYELSADNLTGYFDIVINATSVSTTGQTLPLAQSDIIANTAYDMMYGQKTEFLKYFCQQNSQTFDGFGMLIQQAKLAFELWTGAAVDLTRINTNGLLFDKK